MAAPPGAKEREDRDVRTGMRPRGHRRCARPAARCHPRLGRGTHRRAGLQPAEPQRAVDPRAGQARHLRDAIAHRGFSGADPTWRQLITEPDARVSAAALRGLGFWALTDNIDQPTWLDPTKQTLARTGRPVDLADDLADRWRDAEPSTEGLDIRVALLGPVSPGNDTTSKRSALKPYASPPNTASPSHYSTVCGNVSFNEADTTSRSNPPDAP